MAAAAGIRDAAARSYLTAFHADPDGLTLEVVYEPCSNAAGTTVLLVEQNVKHALAISAQAWVLENGSIVLGGSGPALLTDDKTRRAYLGM